MIQRALFGLIVAAMAVGPLAVQGAGSSFTTVNQNGAQERALREILPRLTVPDGFEISLYAVVPGARALAVAPGGEVVFVGTRRDKVWAVVDADRDGIADRVTDFAPGVEFDIPNGPCLSPDGTLFVAERNRVLAFPDAMVTFGQPDPTAVAVVPRGRLIPPREESSGHSARVCRVGPDGRLYISLGQPYNVQPLDKVRLYDELGIGGIVRMNADGSGREVFTRGIRNSVGHDFNPANGDLWFTDNQVDRMGDEIPPGELNRQTAPGQHFGFPWTNARIEIPAYKHVPRPKGVTFVEPEVEMDAHAADLGMRFYAHNAFPANYRGGIFSAQHGSWNRSTPIGARVMFTAVGEDGRAAGTMVFAKGWLDERTGRYIGRPVDVDVLPDGSLLVSDDHAGAIWRIFLRPDRG